VCDLRIVRPHPALDLGLGVHVPNSDELRRAVRFGGGGWCWLRWPWLDKRIPRNRRRYEMTAAAGQGRGFVEPVLHDIAALAAHGAVGLRQRHAAQAALHRAVQ